MSTGPGRLLDPPHDHFPQPQQVRQVARQLFLGPVGAGRADDEAHALGRVQLAQNIAQAAAILVAFNLARHADAPERRHQHQVPAGNTDVRRQRRALRADALLDYLHEHFVAALEDLLNRRLEPRPDAHSESGRLGTPAIATATTATAARAMSVSAVVRLSLIALRSGRTPHRDRAIARRHRSAESPSADRNRPGENTAARHR